MALSSGAEAKLNADAQLQTFPYLNKDIKTVSKFMQSAYNGSTLLPLALAHFAVQKRYIRTNKRYGMFSPARCWRAKFEPHHTGHGDTGRPH